jgi:hypothetical protein
MMTYESASEAEVLKSLWRPGAPLENTVFAILDPNGRPVIRGGRSPDFVFRDSSDMASTMNQISQYYNSHGGTPEALPSVDTVRLAIDVAACDKRPLAIVVGRSDEERRKLASALAPVAWSDTLIGKLVYTTGGANDLRQVRGATLSSGYLFVSPNLFGTEASVITALGPAVTQSDLERAAKQAIAWHRPQVLEHHEHVHLGHQEGIEWESAIPVTDPHSLQARERDRMHGPPPGF